MFKIGVMSDSFKLPIREGIKKARKLGAEGIQCYAVQGEMAPEHLDADGRAFIRRLCADNGLVISALCGDLGGHGFQIPEENAIKIPKSKAIVDLAVDLHTNVVTTHIGVVPDDTESPTYAIMAEACREIGDYAWKHNVRFAVETGPEPPARLKKFLDTVGSEGMAVNFDPANLVMVLGEDPVKGVHTLGNYIVHTHAKDGIHIKPCDPVKLYASFAVGGIDGFNYGEYFNEVPLGEGEVDWDAYLAALSEVSYQGFLTIEREVGEDPVKDIALAVSFLKQKILNR